MVVLEASSVMTVAGNKDAAVPQAVLDRAELRIGPSVTSPFSMRSRFPRPAGSHHPLRAPLAPVTWRRRCTRMSPCRRLAPTPANLSPALHLMVVDDHALNRLVLSRLLEQEGASLECFESAGAALERLRNGGGSACDVVLSDVQMPEMDGYELAAPLRQVIRRCRSSDPTAHTLAEDRARCLRAGMREHVAKPVDIDVGRRNPAACAA